MDLMTTESGVQILHLVSRGNSIIAEILRLADFIPEELLLESRDDKKYQLILIDFSYFKTPEYYDNKLEKDPELLERAEVFQARTMDILTRFYLLFESVYKYIKDLTRFLEDLDEGIFIQQSLESLIKSNEGKQLLTEAIFLYGVMLLVLDSRIDGLVRERILVAYHRWKGVQAANSNMDEVCKICRSTGLSVRQGKRPSNYPEEYFKRFPIPANFISIIIGRLRTDDIYNQIATYPLPQHRSTALATQATMLYIILNFMPEIMHQDQAKMREIVDKYFPDNWVIAYYMGMVVDLSDAWENFKAAKLALANTLIPQNLKQLGDKYYARTFELIKELDSYLQEGVLSEDFVLDNTAKLLNFLKDCNVTLRWLILHTNIKSKKLKEMIGACANFEDQVTVRLLLSTAQFEYRLRDMFTSLMARKEDNWNEYKRQASERMSELAEYFSGEKALTRVTKNENLQNWFADISSKINSLEYVNATVAGRKIMQLIQALEEVQEFHQLESSLQIQAFLVDTRKFLLQMIRTINIKEEVIVTIQMVSDLSYAWEAIVRYIPCMQESIKSNAGNVIKLRATFLKLASILDLPLVRINQANSRDLISVSEYYSGRLVDFVRQVLQIIPASMFGILNEIVEAQTNKIKEVPTRLEKEKLKEFAQLEERYELAIKTHAISVFTEGMLAMERTLVGVIEVDPKQLLEDGIRRELVRQLSSTIDSVLTFKNKSEEFEPRVQLLSAKLDGFRRSFEYIQDYVNIYALKIWQEELSRIINYLVERECNSFLKIKVQDWESIYQSSTIPIAQFPPSDDTRSINCMGRLAREMLTITSPSKSIYVEQMSTWYDSKTFKEVFSFETIAKVFEALGAYGLSGLDKLFCFMAVQNLQNFVEMYRKQLKADKALHDYLVAYFKEFTSATVVSTSGMKQISSVTSKISKLTAAFGEWLIVVGQIQIIRRQISSELKLRCKVNSNPLANTLDVINRSLILDIQNDYRRPKDLAIPWEDSLLLSELGSYLECSGMSDPLLKIYVTSEPLETLPMVMMLTVIQLLQKFTYEPRIGNLVTKSKTDDLDFTPLVFAVLTVLVQFHSSNMDSFLLLMSLYIRTLIANQASSKAGSLPTEASFALLFLESLGKYRTSVRDTIGRHLSTHLYALARASLSEK